VKRCAFDFDFDFTSHFTSADHGSPSKKNRQGKSAVENVYYKFVLAVLYILSQACLFVKETDNS
jgi:hypothetical protein